MQLTRFAVWKEELKHHKLFISIGILLIIIATGIQTIASRYADHVSSSPVPDIILDNIPVIDLSFLFVYGFIFITAIYYIYAFVYKIRKFHLIMSHFAILILARSFFFILTHMKVHPDVITTTMPAFFSKVLFENDLFFSGHVAIPFLGFLVYRKEKIGIFFLIATIIMSITVLLMHIHYSIDVFAAFFITYGCYKIGNMIFKKIRFWHSSKKL